MNRPNRLTVIAGAVGGLLITATAVAAVAMSDDTPATAEPTSLITQSASPPDPGPGEPSDDRDFDDDSDDSDDAATQPAPTEDGINQDQAIAIAEQALADLGPVPPLDEVEREFEHGSTVWKVEFGDDHEVYVDIATGGVVKLEQDDDDGRGDDDDDNDRHDLDDNDDDDHDDDDDDDDHDDD
ncbi:MAG TPA: PepSY domain-containing protein [Jiangellaceae bacterium]|nr:PepSY domain-containing protein [Jiangellaceae bacterium]